MTSFSKSVTLPSEGDAVKVVGDVVKVVGEGI